MKIEGNIEFYVVEQVPERVVSEMPILPGILNPYGSVNAGAILWFADITAWDHPAPQKAWRVSLFV